jgi:hypothetical protein
MVVDYDLTTMEQNEKRRELDLSINKEGATMVSSTESSASRIEAKP